MTTLQEVVARNKLTFGINDRVWLWVDNRLVSGVVMNIIEGKLVIFDGTNSYHATYGVWERRRRDRLEDIPVPEGYFKTQ